MAGCSKCRYAARGCRRCVENFVPASAVRAAKAAEKYGPPAQPLKPVDANAPAKRPRGRPPGSKNKRDSGTHPKTPALKAAAEAKAAAGALLSPPSAAKSEKRAREEDEDQAHARAHRPAPAPAQAPAQAPASAPAPTPAPAPAPAAPRWDLPREPAAAPRPASVPSHLDERRAPAAATTTTMMSDDEITRRVVGGVGRYGCVGDGDLLGVSFPPELREALARVSESHAAKMSQARGGVGVGEGALQARMAAAMMQARVMLSS
jgi:hypothetical protein